MRDAETPQAAVDLIAAAASSLASGATLRDALPQLASDLCKHLQAASLELSLGAQSGERVAFAVSHARNAPSSVDVESIPVEYRGLRLGSLLVVQGSRTLTEDDRALLHSWSALVAVWLHQTTVEAENRRLELAAQSDPVTGIPNRRAFDAHLQRTWDEAVRTGKPLALVITDIDFFKAYNDRYGHLAGDAALHRFALTIASFANRPGDLTARFGGEEFALLLQDTDEDAAFEIAERLRSTVLELRIPHESSELGVLSTSIGVASMRPSSEHAPSTLISRADGALYRAKRGGRNRCVSSGRHSSTPSVHRSDRFTPAVVAVPNTRVFGRESDTQRCIQALERTRLLTIIGERAVGKTRLAAALCDHASLTRSVVFVDLSHYADSEAVLNALASRFEVAPAVGATSLEERVIDELQQARGVIVFDSADAWAEIGRFVDALLVRARHLTVVVAASAPLRLPGEAVHELHPLQRDDARALFEERRSRCGEATMPSDDLIGKTVETTCGNPLAIELVACVSKPPQMLLDVEAAARTALDALPVDLRSKALSLSVLAPGYAERSALAVANADAHALQTLVQRGILYRYGTGADRYGMVRALAAAARSLLRDDEREAIEKRRYDHVLELATQQRFDEVQADELNVRAALSYAARSNDPHALAVLASRLQRYWQHRARLLEGIAWLDQALRRAPPPYAADEVFANAWRHAGILSRRRSDYLRAARYNESALAAWRALGNQSGIASALNGLALVAHNTGDFERAKRLYEESLAIARDQHDAEAVAMAYNNLAGLAMYRRHFEEAERDFNEALSVATQRGDADMQALVNNNLAQLRFLQGRHEEALAHAHASLQRRLETGETAALAQTWINIANIELSLGNSGDAWRASRDGLLLYRRINDQHGIANALNAIARLLHAFGRDDEAARMMANADALLGRFGVELYGADQHVRELLVRDGIAARGAREAARDTDEAFEEALSALNVR